MLLNVSYHKVGEYIWLCGRDLNDFKILKIVSEYDQEIPQSQTADYPVAPRNGHKVTYNNT